MMRESKAPGYKCIFCTATIYEPFKTLSVLNCIISPTLRLLPYHRLFTLKLTCTFVFLNVLFTLKKGLNWWTKWLNGWNGVSCMIFLVQNCLILGLKSLFTVWEHWSVYFLTFVIFQWARSIMCKHYNRESLNTVYASIIPWKNMTLFIVLCRLPHKY